MRTVKLSPSLLGFTLADCERCFVREVAHGVRRPGTLSEIYNVADAAMKDYFERKKSEVHDLGVGPRFIVKSQGLHVQSKPLVFEDCGVQLVVSGRLDALVETTDGEVLVVDYKTTTSDEPPARTYEWQLHAYAHALEHPQNTNAGSAVDGLALLVNRPMRYGVRAETKECGMGGPTAWIEVVRDDTKFLSLLRRVAELVAERVQPIPNPKCGFCRYYGAIPLAISGAA